MTRGISTRTPPWAGHRQDEWEARAGNTALPLWLRVVSLAHGCHYANGHACYGPGDLALALSQVDMLTGEILGPTRQNVARAISTAIGYGWLAEGSSLRCLVVPPSLLRSGPPQRAHPCAYHGVAA